MRRDGSKEAAKLLRKDPRPRTTDGVPKILTELGSDGDVAAALREWLRKNAGKVMGLFKSWDYDGNGSVDRMEFRKAMKALGLQAPAAHVDAIFSDFDQVRDARPSSPPVPAPPRRPCARRPTLDVLAGRRRECRV